MLGTSSQILKYIAKSLDLFEIYDCIDMLVNIKRKGITTDRCTLVDRGVLYDRN